MPGGRVEAVGGSPQESFDIDPPPSPERSRAAGAAEAFDDRETIV
jgi:hypothetical protein